MRRGNWCGAAACVVACVSLTGLRAARGAPAFEPGEAPARAAGAVTGVGSAKAERQPDLLRVQFQLTGEGKDVKEALARLREREKVTREKLARLGAAGKAVEVAEPRLAVAAAGAQAQLNNLIRMRSGRVGGAAGPATGPAQQPVRVTAAARAEWPLAAKTTEEFLVLAQDLQTKVAAAELVPKDAASNLTPEQQEELEEQALLGEAGGQVLQQGPHFLYVSKVSPEDRAKLTAEAFAKAREEATRLAKAAGAELGPIRQLTSTAGTDEPDALMYGQPDPFAYARAAYAAAQPRADDTDDEAAAAQPGRVTYRVTVSASFAIR